MALVKFYRGPLSKYNANNDPDVVFFATDQGTIHVNGVTYGGFKKELLDGVITNLDVEGQRLKFKKRVNDVYEDVDIELLKAEDSSITIGNIVKENGVIDGSTIKVNVKQAKAGEDGLKLGDDGLYVDLTKTNEKIADETSARTEVIQGMSLASTGGTGKYITTITQKDGKVTATAADLTSVNVKRTPTSKVDGQVDMTGTTVENALVDLAKAVDSTKKAAATYSIEKVTTGLGANVKEAYQLVQTVNGEKSYVKVQIPIYKDRSLKSVELTTTNDKGRSGQFMKYTYNLDDKTAEEVYVDVSQFLLESEFKNGLQVSESGEVSIKLDANNENEFLTVSDGGVKLSGVQTAIDTAKNAVQSKLDAEITRATQTEGTNKAAIDVNAAAIAKLNGDKTAEGSVAKTVDDAINSALTWVDVSIDTPQQ